MSGAIADCERVLSGLWGQPANSITALAFLVAGGFIWFRGHSRWVAIATASVGVGSFLFHGPMPPWSDWAHDVSLAWLLVVIGLSMMNRERWSLAALGLLAVVVAVLPDSADPIAVAVTVLVLGVILLRHRTPRMWSAMGLLGVGAIVGRLSATGGPWCNPDTLLQGHAFWHLTAAAAVLLFMTKTGRQTTRFAHENVEPTRDPTRP